MRAAMDATIDAIFLTGPQAMRYLYVNDSACRSLGYTREQLLHKAPFELLGKTRQELSREHGEILAAKNCGSPGPGLHAGAQRNRRRRPMARLAGGEWIISVRL